MPKPHKTTRWQMVVIANDLQIPFHDQKALALLKLFLRREKPDWLILNGDVQDCWEVSSFDRAPKTGKEFIEEIEVGKKIIREFRRALPRARITWIEGNHEFRLRRYLIQNAPELYGLPKLSIPGLFRLKELRIQYVACRPGATKFTDTVIRVGNLYVGHWDTVAKDGGYAAKRLVDDKVVSLLQGHTHRFGAHARTTLDGKVLLGIENFCLASQKASYEAFPNWQLGFSVVYVQPTTGRFQWFPIAIATDYRFVWNGWDYTVRA